MHFAGQVSLYIMIVIEFINGICFDDFGKMTEKEKLACKESINELHKNDVVHGDIRPENFIVTQAKNRKIS
jgi:tRNA A-37 threonylcarbamoyl transferase component Bud32